MEYKDIDLPFNEEHFMEFVSELILALAEDGLFTEEGLYELLLSVLPDWQRLLLILI